MINENTLLNQFPEPYLSQIKKIIRKCNKLLIENSSEVKLTDSRLLGTPYWPKNKVYPINSKGKSMTLLAQINCKDLVIPLGLPNEGLLQFFVDENEMMEIDGEHKTIFHPTIDETNIITNFEKEVGLEGLFYKHNNLKLTIIESIEIPHPNGIEFKNQFKVKYMNSELSSETGYYELAEENSMHKIGHYTDWWHNDLRKENGSITNKKGCYVPIFQLHTQLLHYVVH